MTYETYSFLVDAIDNALTKHHADFLTAVRFIPPCSVEQIEAYAQMKMDIPRNVAYAQYCLEQQRLLKMKDELLKAVQAVHKNNPNVEMRKFWKIEE